MYCESCGSFFPDGQAYCTMCGKEAPFIAKPGTTAQTILPDEPVQAVKIPIEPAQPVNQQNNDNPDFEQSVQLPTPKKYIINYTARVGLIAGIISVVAVYIPYTGIVPAIIGIIFSLLGMRKVSERGGKGNCIAGLILSGVGIALWLLTVIFAIIRNTKG